MNESGEPLTAPSMPPLPPLNVDQMKASHQMLVGFRKGVREGTFQGEHLIHIAQGLMFLDTMIGQSEGQIQMAKDREKAVLLKAKDEIKAAGGKIGVVS